MNQLCTQTKYAIKRELLRNPRFFLFNLAMPAFFYILFTKILVQGSASEKQQFNLNYMDSMIFSVSAFLAEDRQENMPTLLAITPAKQLYYYVGLMLTMTVMNMLSASVILTIATIINGVHLTLSSLLLIVGLSALGGLPLMLIGVLVAKSGRPSSVNSLCNLIVFPMAIISGLWWPIGLLPHWMQQIGKLMPTYAVNSLLNVVTKQMHFNWSFIVSLAGWTGALLIIIWLLSRAKNDRSIQA
ncbi:MULTISPECIES: ABC transporter permease [Furfurilactobacillus]|uniref:ABC transporter permease n=1 Tax=Furfurilactobacillus rossiae TaxID=231049 RepID=A0A7C9IZS9_9LACO|nr:ABC transporter permease [Furfurilactobacillus milii]MYV05038.1 ABC transporter permease [Furfurilactobacillus milii]